MSARINTSAWKYAIIKPTPNRREVVALTNSLHVAQDTAHGSYSIIETKEIEVFRVHGYVGRDHAAKGYIGYDPVDASTDLSTKYL